MSKASEVHDCTLQHLLQVCHHSSQLCNDGTGNHPVILRKPILLMIILRKNPDPSLNAPPARAFFLHHLYIASECCMWTATLSLIVCLLFRSIYFAAVHSVYLVYERQLSKYDPLAAMNMKRWKKWFSSQFLTAVGGFLFGSFLRAKRGLLGRFKQTLSPALWSRARLLRF